MGLVDRAFYRERQIFTPGVYGAECHSSTITELPDGSLLAAWWAGSYEGATDVALWASRRPFGDDAWRSATIVADVPERFEGNPVLFSLPDGRVWLFFVVMEQGPPKAIQIMQRQSRDFGHTWSPLQKFVTPPGFRTRNHLIVMKNEEILFPLFDQPTGRSVFLITRDGLAWETSSFIDSDTESIQPTVITREDGTLFALMRTWNDDPSRRFLLQSESQDYGRTWSQPIFSTLPAVDSAVEMIRLRNGHVVVAFNDGNERERTPLSMALSLDEGRTWPYRRSLESGSGSFSYPSLVQTRDGHIHITYSHNRRFIKHVEVNEAWIVAGQKQ